MSDRIQKLEALLERVRRNKTHAPVRAAALFAEAPLALEALAPSPVPTPVAAAPVPLTPVPAPVTPITPPATPVPDAHLEAPAAVITRTEPPPPVATPSWQPEPGSAVQARPSTMPPMEISDDDLLEVTTLPPEAEVTVESRSPSVEDDDDIDVDVEEENAPVSSSRFKVPGTLDEALTHAAQLEGEREIPIKTPPPESGPQEALPLTGLEAPRFPDVDQLEADLMPPPSMGPTAEQLGETIELEAPRGPELEIDVAASAEPRTEPPPEELEVTLPRASMPSGLYDVNVAAPPPELVVPPEAPAAELREVVTAPAQVVDPGPERITRPPLGATDVAEVTLTTPLAPKTFVELLDASLGA